jgi:capsular polysaccharide biosynthesis protein
VTLGSALRAVKHNWHIVAVCIVAALVAATVLDLTSDDQYTSEQRLIIGPSSALSIEEALNSLDVLSRRSIPNDLAEIVTSVDVVTEAARAADVDGDLSRYETDARVAIDANVVVVSVSGPDPNVTTALADALSVASAASFERLYRPYEVEVLDGAEVPSEPGGLSLFTTLLAAAIAGALLGMVIAVGRAAVEDADAPMGDGDLLWDPDPVQPDPEMRPTTRQR